MKQYEQAEKYLNKAADVAVRAGRSPISSKLWLAKLYLTQAEGGKALEILKNYERQAKENHSAYVANYYLTRAQADSVMGNYDSALHYLFKSKSMTDSIFNIEKEKQTQELEYQYETGKKEDALREQQENIRFLNQENRLQKEHVKLQLLKLEQGILRAKKDESDLRLKDAELKLRGKDIAAYRHVTALQTAQLNEGRAKQNITIGVILFLLIISGLIYWQLKEKSKASRIINKKNLQLASLLAEKDWLLKEIHHRVKNNLHIVISLLESQCHNIDPLALKALETSKNRIYAISLIHQKLYQSADIKTIDMSDYIPELISYLRESFLNDQHINFKLIIDPINLSVREAIPIGLIINEAVTNSLKYAFRKMNVGLISIILKDNGGDDLDLSIEDNGSGFDETTLHTRSSLGLTLIEGLTSQLEGSLTLTSSSGTKICISSIKISHEDGQEYRNPEPVNQYSY